MSRAEPPSARNTVEGFRRWRRRVAESRITAIMRGREVLDRRPTADEIEESKERWDNARHEI